VRGREKNGPVRWKQGQRGVKRTETKQRTPGTNHQTGSQETPGSRATRGPATLPKAKSRGEHARNPGVFLSSEKMVVEKNAHTSKQKGTLTLVNRGQGKEPRGEFSTCKKTPNLSKHGKGDIFRFGGRGPRTKKPNVAPGKNRLKREDPKYPWGDEKVKKRMGAKVMASTDRALKTVWPSQIKGRRGSQG